MRRGFTLVEMLVATALVMLIMLLFAEIFEQAIGTVRAQRGLIANDEKARGITQTLRTDLNDSTYRASVGRGASLVNGQGVEESPSGIVALSPGDRPDPRQRGFTYISENDPLDDSDDVLHLTVSVDETLRNPLVSDPGFAPYQGRAFGVGNTAIDLNQPELDDGQLNGAGGSRAAEICYFLRGTTLFRSVKLLRDPLPSGSPPFGTQPSDAATGAPLLPNVPNATIPNALHYRDFDYAATNIAGPLGGQLHFHGLESLDNSLGLTNSPLANPQFRFGYAPSGVPREFGLDDNFIGRFTQEETSHETANGLGQNGFRWPGVNDGPNANIVDSDLVVSPENIVAVELSSPPNAIYNLGVDMLLRGPRTGEDILMTGVEAFDVDFWDPGYSEGDFDDSGAWDPNNPLDDLNMNGIQDFGIWVDLGNDTNNGMFGEGWAPRIVGGNQVNLGNTTWGRQNGGYGPNGPATNHVYDTWHPSLGANAPYQPLQVALPGIYYWQPNNATVPGTVFMPDIFGLDGAPGQAGNDDDGDTITDFISPGIPDTDEIGRSGGDDNRSIGYVAIAVAAPGTTGPRIPEWPREPGALVRDGNILWQCFDNRIGLEKIRITIRFRDPGTDQARQVTLIHAFAE